MAQIFSATANSNATIGYALYGSSTWNKGTSNGACKGAYQNTSANGSRVGVMIFTGAGAALKGKSSKASCSPLPVPLQVPAAVPKY